MTSEKKHMISFGRYLKSVRIEKGIDLTEIAEETKILHSILMNLESENHEKLPSPLFVKGFIRGYAELVGADAEMAEKSYTNSLEKHKESLIPESELSKRKTVFRYYVTALSCLLICIIVFSVWLLSDTEVTSKDTVHKQSVNSDKNPRVIAEPNSSETKPSNPEQSDKEILTLAVSAVEKTWLKIIIDDQSPKEYHLESGDHLELEASSKFNILVGNAPGVKLLFNNKPIKVFGKSGQVVTMKLP
jgi:cytoskeleton protein RodZ